MKSPPGYRQVKEELFRLFDGKCAYCGTPLASGEACIEHFQPKILRPDLEFSTENLLLVCRSCNLIKGSRNPQRSDGAPLLLNPRTDNYPEHIRFEADGRSVPTTDRGKATIEILQLNRPQLIQERRARRAAMHRFQDAARLLEQRQSAGAEPKESSVSDEDKDRKRNTSGELVFQKEVDEERRRAEEAIATQTQRADEAERRAVAAEVALKDAKAAVDKVLNDPQVKVAEVKAEVDRFKIVTDKEIAQLKIQADERAAQLQITVKKLEGDNQLAVAREQSATARAVAAEKTYEKYKTDTDNRTERLKSIVTLLAALLTASAAITAAYVAAKFAPKGSAANTVTSSSILENRPVSSAVRHQTDASAAQNDP